MNRDQPVGVFDSGVGGISVLRELVRVLPHENFIYYGDSKNAPYGTKSPEEVKRLSYSCVDHLLGQGAKAIVVACNTATSAAIASLRQDQPQIPFIGIEPAIKPAALFLPHPFVVVMATSMTIREKKFHELFERFDEEAEIAPVSCSRLVEFVERGETRGAAIEQYLTEKLSPYLGKADAIVLGCTHFPFAREAIQKVAGEKVLLFDGAEGTARECKNRLKALDLLSDRTENGTVEIQNSLGESGAELARRLLDQT